MQSETLCFYYSWRYRSKPIQIDQVLNSAIATEIKNKVRVVGPSGFEFSNGEGKVESSTQFDIDLKTSTGEILCFVAKLEKFPAYFVNIASNVNVTAVFDDGSKTLKKELDDKIVRELQELIESKIEFNPHQQNSDLFHKAIREFDSLILLNKEEIRDELKYFLSSEDSVEDWSKKIYGKIMPIVDLTSSKSPVFVFAGDPGTGKTVLAKSIGAVVSKELGVSVNTWLISLALRGVGFQGRASTMVTKLFNYAKIFIQSNNKPLLIIFDESEAMVGSRKNAGNGEGADENIAIVNAILRGIDQLSTDKCKASVIFISNIPMRIDEALMRRCSYYWFPRPDNDTRRKIFAKSLNGFPFSDADIEELVNATEPKVIRENYFAYTASDIVTVILYKAIRRCVNEKRNLDKQTILSVCKESYPTGFPKELI